MDTDIDECAVPPFETLSEDTLIHILSLLDPRSLAKAEIAIPSVYHVSKKFDSLLWKQHARIFYGVEDLNFDRALHRIPSENFKSYRDAYRILRYAYGKHAPDDETCGAVLTPSLFCRARRAWRIIERSASQDVRDSLLPGASDEDMTEDVCVPRALQAIYSIWNGQGLQFDEALRQSRRHRISAHASIFHGLFGGYTVYHHCVNTRLYPIERMLGMSKLYWETPQSGIHENELVFAASFNELKNL